MLLQFICRMPYVIQKTVLDPQYCIHVCSHIVDVAKFEFYKLRIDIYTWTENRTLDALYISVLA